MVKMSLAVGTLVFIGFLLILFGVIAKASGVNLLTPAVTNVSNIFIIANTCFLMALIVSKFDKE